MTRYRDLLDRIRVLSFAERRRTQHQLAENLLAGWVGDEVLGAAELAELVETAIEQHALDDPDPGRRARDVAMVRAALGTPRARAWDAVKGTGPVSPDAGRACRGRYHDRYVAKGVRCTACVKRDYRTRRR